MSKLFILEGVCCAGKSTLSTLMEKKIGLKRIKECTEDQKEWKLPKTTLDAINNEKLYFHIEEGRMEESIKLCSENHDVIADRGPISIVAVAYGYNKRGVFNTFNHAMNHYIQMIEKQKYYLPSSYFYLDVDIELIEERNKRRYMDSGLLLEDFWINHDAILYQKEFYSYYGELLGGRWHVLDASLETNILLDTIKPRLNMAYSISYNSEVVEEYLELLYMLSKKLKGVLI